MRNKVQGTYVECWRFGVHATVRSEGGRKGGGGGGGRGRGSLSVFRSGGLV